MHAALDRLDKSSSRMKTHPPASKKVAEEQAAAQPPANEKLAGAAAVQVEVMGQAETKKPEDTSFLTLLRTEIQKVIPKQTEGVKDFMAGDDRQQLKGAMTGNINQQKEDAAGGIRAASNQPPDPSKVPGKTVTPLPTTTAPTPPAIGAADAMPVPRAEADVSLQQGKQDANNALSDANVTPTQLQKANDPRFSAVLTAKAAADQQADTAPTQYRAGEQKTLADASAKATGDERQGLAALTGQRGKSDHAVVARQLSAKEKDEARRKEVTDHIQRIYDTTKQTVDKKLDSLEADVSKMFDEGADAAVADMKAYIDVRFDDRYSGLSGKALWLKDKLLPLPDEVNAWFDEARAHFLKALDDLVVRIAGVVEARLKEAKDEIARGQKEIHDYVEHLDPDLQAIGKAAEQEMRGRFDELRQGVDDRKNDLAQKLAQRYKDAYDKGDAALKEMKDAHKSLLQKLKEAIEEVIKVLRAFKERIMGMLKKGAETIGLIVADPIGFLKNLLNAIKQGLSQFINNIWTHLKVGFMKWLFGTLADAGIQIPTEFSLGAILKLVLQILGLTYDRIRAKAVKLIGARNMMLLEKAWEVISALITGGPAALWEKIKEFLGNLKEMVIDALQNWVVETVIKSAITKLATMFNPVGAIVQAIITIYNTVMFFIERINQIVDLVEAIINSVNKIATGDVGAAANWVEQALARAIPVIIGFLARLLGLGGLSDKIKSIIHKVQAVVDKAIDKLIEKIVAGIGKLFGKGKAGAEPKDAKDVVSATVIAATKKDMASVSGKQYRSAEEFDEALAVVYHKNQPQGLKSLSVKGVEEDPEKPFEVVAEASPAEPITLVNWKDLFVDGEGPKDAAEKFAKAGYTTNALLVVNGRAESRIIRNTDGAHAEENTLHTAEWAKALDTAFYDAHATPPKDTTIKLIINRTPCHTWCTPKLKQALATYWSRFSDPAAKKRVNFYLIATGVYESKEGLEVRKSIKGGPTTTSDLKELAGSGWHLQALQVDKEPTVRGNILSEYIRKLLRKLNKVKEPH
jgi:hypothetical protein